MPEYRGMNLIMPAADHEIRPYFEAARQGRMVLKQCNDCNLLRYPPGAACPWCNSLDFEWSEVSGRGTIHSYEIVTQAIQPGFADWVPYPVVLVELDEQRGVPTSDEGLRVIANLVTDEFRPEAEANVAIGKRVHAVFQPLDDEVALPQFTLADEPAEGRVWRYAG
ncbi:MAG: Zn-ribbon domain-containing OB-fold protein [Dehalococcoidia bacterium]